MVMRVGGDGLRLKVTELSLVCALQPPEVMEVVS